MTSIGTSPRPDLSLERALAVENGAVRIAGVDEAGRGALAGPVFAAAVILPLDDTSTNNLREVRDSKLLSPIARERLFNIICESNTCYAIGSCSAEWIDEFGIMSATRQAMTEAVSRLPVAPNALLVDGPLRLIEGNIPQKPVVRGDRISLSIAAVFILAKVSRDRYMLALHEAYPEYNFNHHKGYGTAGHLAALGRHGPCDEHRRSFAPLKLGWF